ncbi:hypothetical protein [Aliidiomarina sanyensis]|uniref:Glucose-inhibited division protein B n=1 Tax=Aliidiomarina sanyensis TaxID=1249555 RepID=A0A432WKG5_9GAMM|nr:hypothetical protein [Aliidiomarina sanyensis]RUO34254.1 hypothetical protein CWE11_05875 [Aliidiomarina sanyensis]
MRWILLILVTFTLAACVPQPRELALHVVAAEAQTLDGQLVKTSGVVRMYDDPLHYWVEDGQLNRVGLEGQNFARYVDQDVVVMGVFRMNADRGRYIEVSQIRTLR